MMDADKFITQRTNEKNKKIRKIMKATNFIRRCVLLYDLNILYISTKMNKTKQTNADSKKKSVG